jgi:SAM-dependent methyltransferase
MTCPSCTGSSFSPYSKDKNSSYFLCSNCSLVFVPRSEIVSLEKEKARYDAHQNDEKDQGYRNYLKNIVARITPHINGQSKGLDFGCGRTNLLGKLFQEQEIDVNSYDLFYYPDESIFYDEYDFIVMSEVIEHLREPGSELLRLRKCLRPQGKFFIKTRFRPAESSDFDQWFYKRDITHVQFYSHESFQVLGRELSLQGPVNLGDDLYLFRDDA